MSSLDLLALLRSLSEAAVYWKASLDSSQEVTAQKASVQKPLEEIEKLAKLIRAHATKMGIVFQPENIRRADSAYKAVEQYSGSAVLLVSVVAQLDARDLSVMYQQEIVGEVVSLLLATDAFARELLALVAESEAEYEKNEDKSEAKQTDNGTSDDASGIDQRLVSVGRIWDLCDGIVSLVKSGKLGLLNRRIKQSITLVDDGLDEFTEWAKDPSGFEMEDPFGFSDSEDELEVPSAPKTETDDSAELVLFATLWLERFKLIKLLLSSLVRSLPSVVTGTTVDTVYTTQKDIVALVDKLIVDLMLEGYLGDECHEYAEEITKKCLKLVRAVRAANKGSDNKVRWCDAWEKKFGAGAEGR